MVIDGFSTRVFSAPGDFSLVRSAIERLERHDWMLCSDRPMLLALLEHGQSIFPGLVWIVVGDGHGPAAVAPLQKVEATSGRVPMRELWSPTRFDLLYGDLLIRDDVAPVSVGRSILASRVFDGLHADVIRVAAAPAGSGFHRMSLALAASDTVLRPGASVLTYEGDSAMWEQSLTRNLRGQIRQSERRLRSRGDIRVMELRSGDKVDEAIDRFVALEAAGYKAGMSPLAAVPADRAILSTAVRAHADTATAHLMELWVGDSLAASQLGVIKANRLHLIKVAFNEQFENASPGTFLMAELIRRRLNDGRAQAIDCCVRQPWHDRWHPRVEDRAWAAIPNMRTPKGIALRTVRALRRLIKRQQ